MNLVFYLSALVAIIATGMVITRSNAMHALLYLVLSLLAISLMFFTLGAPFVAALEVIVYAGAIMVLFIFAIMLLNMGTQPGEVERQRLWTRGWVGPVILSLILLGELVYVLAFGAASAAQPAASGGPVDPHQVGVSLFTTYLIGVELASILLLASVIGAYHLGEGRREEEALRRERMVEVTRASAREAGIEPIPEGAEALEAEGAATSTAAAGSITVSTPPQ